MLLASPGVVSTDAADPRVDEWAETNRLFVVLIARAQAGSVLAFEELYDRSARWLLSRVRLLVDDGQAEDVLAESYAQVWETLATYDSSRSPPTAWMLMIARSRALDHLRREKRHGPAYCEPMLADAEEPAPGDGPDQILSVLEQRRLVQLSLERLSEREQLVLGLAYFRESTHREIAQITGLPLGSVKSIITRSHEKLRAALGVRAAPNGLDTPSGRLQ